MGSRLFSNTTNLLGGHDFTNPAHRLKVSRLLGIPEEKIPRVNSLPYHKIMEGIGTGAIKGLWVIATNTSHSWIHQHRCNELLSKLDFLVVQDMYHSTETAQKAHLVLPAAGWGEKEGTFINSERRIGVIKKVSRAPGQALADFSIFRLVAQYWGCGDLFEKWKCPEDVFQLMKKLSEDQPCEITGIENFRHIEEQGGIQWPFKSGEVLHSRERRLFADGRFFHADGRAKFIFSDSVQIPENLCEEFPFVLLTGRGTSSQWHTQTRTGKSDVLKKLYPRDIYVEINPSDADRLGIAPQTKVLVESLRGKLEATAFITPHIAPGQVFLPMHYATCNQLTYPSFDPYSHQPSYKYCAVSLRPLPAGYSSSFSLTDGST